MLLDVESVAHGGSCVARPAGQARGPVVLVRHALPGERVRAVVTEDGPPVRADAVEVLTPSPDRVEPPCPYAGPGRCGGCDWQHASVPAQRRLKASLVSEQLRRLAGIELGVSVEAVAGDDDGLGWRTRVQFAVTEQGALGFRRSRSHDVLPVERCLIAASGVESLGLERASWAGLEQVEAIASSAGDRSVVVTGPGRFPRLPEDVSVLRAGRRGVEAVRGRPGVRETALGRAWWVGGSGFWQVHPGAPEALSAAVLEAAEPAPGDLALDLYGGVGLFAAALAPRVREVILVEADVRACGDARQNLRDLPAVRVVEGRTDAALERLGLGRAELVVLDPPRRGAGERVVELVAGLHPRRVVHVACDPGALARDVASFARHGYALRALRAFDLFPMTQHVECVATLEPA